MQCALKIAKFETEQIPLFIYITVGGKIFSRKIGRLDHNIQLHLSTYLAKNTQILKNSKFG